MTLSLTEIEAVVADLQNALAGAAFTDFRQLDESSAILVLTTGGGPRFVRLTAAPRVSRIHLTGNPPPKVRGATGFSFEGKVFRELKGMALQDVRTAFRDRVVILAFAGASHGRKLIFECSGHHANLYLTDGRDEILGMLLPSHSHRRDLRPGRRYSRPLKVEGEPLDAFRFAAGAGAGDLSARIEAAYALEAAREADAVRAARVRRDLRARMDADQRLAERLRGDLARATEGSASPQDSEPDPSGARAARQAAALPAIQVRLEEVTLRMGQTQAALMAILEGAPDALARGEAWLRQLQAPGHSGASGPSRDASGSLPPRAEAANTDSGMRRGQSAERPTRHRVFATRSGSRILVAADARDNAELTFRTAQDDDLWFQVEGGGGAHVLLPGALEDRPFDELLDAALLAVHFSGADPAREVPVTCTHRRNLRPERRSPEPGAVRVVRAQTIRVRPDPTRLRRLLASESRPRRRS